MTDYPFTTADSIASIISTMNAASASDTFTFSSGTYRGIQWTAKASQVVRAATDAKVILSGAIVLNASDFALFNTGGFDYYRVQITHTFYTADQTIGSYTIGSETGYERAWMNIAMWVDNANWRNMENLTDLNSTPNAFYVDYTASPQYLYVKNNPAELGSSVIEINQTEYLCEFTVANLTFQNVIIEKYASRIQRAPVYCSNSTTGSGLSFFNVTSRYNNSCGVRVGDGASIVCSRLNSNMMAGYSGKGDNVSFIGVEVGNNNLGHVNRGFEAGGGKLSGGASVSCDNAVIRGCYFHDNYGKSIWFDIECGYVEKCYIDNNLITNGYDAGIFWETCFDVIIANNTLINNCNSGSHTNQPYDCQLMVVNSQVNNEAFLQVYGNVVVVANTANSGGGIGVTQSNRGNSTINVSIELLTKKVRVFNNSVYHPAGTGRNGLAANYKDTDFYATYDNLFMGNLYFSLATTDGLFQYNGSNQAFSAWQTNTVNQDTTASGASITASLSGAPTDATWRTRSSNSYQDTIRAIKGLISYFPMNEASGTVAYDRSPYGTDRTNDGTYTSATLAQTGIGDGNTAVQFVRASNTRMNAYTARFNTALNKDLVTYGAWVKFSGAGDWTDGGQHGMIRLGGTTGAGKWVGYIRKPTTNSTLEWFLQNDTTSGSITTGSHSDTGWMFLVFAYDRAEPLARAYKNGATAGSDTTLGAGGGTDLESIYGYGRGSGNTGNNLNGYMAHAFVVSDQLSDATVSALYQYNRAPVVTVTNGLADAQAGVAYSQLLITAVSDDSGATPTYSWTNKPSWLSFDGTTLTGTPSSGDVGEYYFALSAADVGGLTTNIPLVITVDAAASTGGSSSQLGSINKARIRTRGKSRGMIWH